MEPNQAKGYLLEFEILMLLGESGYVNVRKGQIRGRGANHQIDAYGVLSIPTAFIYPIRLLSESKFHKDPIELETVRNFVGVMKDISENYVVSKNHLHNSGFRHTDAGCIFSITPFRESAQEYAWAHNIFLVSFSQITLMNKIKERIEAAVESQNIKTILDDNEKNKQKRLIKEYKKYIKGISIIEYPTIVIGILDNVYPVVLVGKRDWIQKIRPPEQNDILDARKDYRQDFPDSSLQNTEIYPHKPLEHIFHISIQEQTVAFSLPHFAANKILKRIEKSTPEEKIAELQIPFINKNYGNFVRRIISLDLKMPL